MLRRFCLVCIFMSTALFAGSIEIMNAYVRTTPPNVPNSAAFMQIKNKSNEDIFLQKASSKSAQVVELHEHVMSNGMMKMQQIPQIKIPAQTTVELQPGGLHVMLIGLTHPLVANESIDSLTLIFSNNEEIILNHVPIKTVMQGMKHDKMKH